MQVERLRHFAMAMALLVGSMGICDAQETYYLRGGGAIPGTTCTQNTIMKMKMKLSGQGQSTDSMVISKIRGTILIKAVDPGGDVIEASAKYSGEMSMPGEQPQKFPSANLFDKTVECKLEDGNWSSFLDEKGDDPEIQKELEDFPMPSLQREYLPIVGVPVGHEWEINPEEYQKIMAIQNPKYAKLIKDLTGHASYSFERVGIVNGKICAYIKTKYSFKGNMYTDETQSSSIKINLKGNSSEIRRLDLGILVRQDSVLDMSGSGQGVNMSMSVEASVNQSISGNQ